jgi:hypothetical protein
MAYGRKQKGLVAAAILVALTTCSTPPNSADSRGLCLRSGFAAGTEAFQSCVDELDRLAQSSGDLRKQCEGVRQQVLATPARSASFEGTIVAANAAYQSCMSAQTTGMTRLQLPDGRALTCRRVGDQISCE